MLSASLGECCTRNQHRAALTVQHEGKQQCDHSLFRVRLTITALWSLFDRKFAVWWDSAEGYKLCLSALGIKESVSVVQWAELTLSTMIHQIQDQELGV